MAIGGFLQGLGLAYGNSLIQGTALEQRQAQADLMKQEAAQSQMQTQQMQQEMQTRKSIGAFIQSQTQLEGADAANPLNQAKMYTKAAGLAASQGDLASAQEMSGLARQAQQDGIEQTKALAQQQAQKKEALATAADNLPDNPSQDQVSDLVRKAVDAGVDPLSIPKPGTPALMTWVNQQKLAGMTSSQRAEFVQKAADFKLNQDRLKQENQNNNDLKRLQINATATYREGMLQEHRDALAARGDRGPQIIDIGGRKAEFDPDGNLKGERNSTDPRYVFIGDAALTSAQKQGVSRGSFAAAEITRTLTNVQRLDPDVANSPFAGLGAHTPFEAFLKVGANELTPTQSQMINVAAAGMGNQLASLDSSLGGRMAAGKAQEDLQNAAIRQSGESGYTAAYKLANAKELTLTALRHLPGNFKDTPEGKQQIQETESSVPFTTDDVLAAMRKDPKASDSQIRQLVSSSARLHTALDSEIKNSPEVGLPGTGDSGAGTAKAPIPPDIQSLVDKYRSK